jgi:hypothetical protein
MIKRARVFTASLLGLLLCVSLVYALEVTSLSPPSGSNGEDTSIGVFGTGFEQAVEVSLFGVDLFNPSIVGTCDTPGAAGGVYVSGNYAYVGDSSEGVQVIDISNPASPHIVGTCNTPGLAGDVYVSGNYAYVTDSYAGVQVIDVSNPVSPSIVGTCGVSGHAVAICASGNHAYVADGSAHRLYVIDVSAPTNPHSVGSCDTMSDALGVYVSGNYAYVADNVQGLQVIDVSNPSNPFIVGTCDTPHQAYDVYVSGNYAYVADGASGVQVIDVSDPNKPSSVGSCNTPYESRGIYVSGNHAYVTDYSASLEVVDVSNPANPHIIDSCATQDSARGVYVSGGYAYVADVHAGLQVISGFVSLADVIWVSDTELTANVPAGLAPGTYNLRVSNPGGESATLNNAFTVTTTGGYTILGYFHEAQYGPGDLAYDEATDVLWASDIVKKKIRKIDPNTGSVLTNLNVSYNELPLGLTYRNNYLWNSDQWANPPDGLIHKVDPANGSSIHSITGLGGLTFDHRGWLWCTNWVELSALDPANGSILDTITLPGFDLDYDQTLGLAFDEGTQTLWISVVTNAWDVPGQGPQTNYLLNVALDGTVLSTQVFDPDPALDGYQLVGLAFDNNNNILWANYSLFDRPPTWDDTYIYKLSVGGPTAVPVIDNLRRKRREPGQKFNIVGSNFGPGNAGDYVRIGAQDLPYNHNRIIEWTPTNIKVKIPKKKYVKNGCAWFQGLDEKKVNVWVHIGGVDSNKKNLTLLKPADCQ